MQLLTQVAPLWSKGKHKSPTSKCWSYPDGNRYKNVRYDVFLGLSLLRTSPVNFWFNSTPNLCKTTYGHIILARLSKGAFGVKNNYSCLLKGIYISQSNKKRNYYMLYILYYFQCKLYIHVLNRQQARG
jgi:hypothetical protein